MIGERLKVLRNKRNLLQKDLAEKLNLSQQTISLYESEKRQPDYQILQNIADLFNVSVDYLLGRTDIENYGAIPIREPETKYITSDKVADEIHNLSPESQDDLKRYLELLKIKDMQKRNNDVEVADDLTSIE